ncbi:MAG: CZB domain-containing protein [Rhodobacter sp.]|jgi:hypothetical protein|nr:CZB domain-containing protein [Rhodobacter sp.]
MTTQTEMETTLRNAMDAHAKWKLRLKTAMTTRHSDISPEHAACDDRCEFGKWLYSEQISDETRSSMPFVVVRNLHAEFHQVASVALEGALNGSRRARDDTAREAFDDCSAKLNKALQKWLGEVRAT